MSAPAKGKPGPKVDPRRYPCGHARSEANTVIYTTQGRSWVDRKCRTCESARSQKRRRAVHAAVKPPKFRRSSITRKPWIQPTPRTLALIEEARVQYNRETGAVQDSTDRRQHNLWGPR